MNRLQANDRAPEFVARDFLGAPVDLQPLRGHKVMLSFYRYASCPLCNLRMRDLIRGYDAWGVGKNRRRQSNHHATIRSRRSGAFLTKPS